MRWIACNSQYHLLCLNSHRHLHIEETQTPFFKTLYLFLGHKTNSQSTVRNEPFLFKRKLFYTKISWIVILRKRWIWKVHISIQTHTHLPVHRSPLFRTSPDWCNACHKHMFQTAFYGWTSRAIAWDLRDQKKAS